MTDIGFPKKIPMPIDQSCIFYAKLDEASGNIYDYSSNQFVGTATDLTYSQTGKFGTACSFNGTSSRVVFADTTNLGEVGDHTYMVWTKSTGTPNSTKYIFCHYNWTFKWFSSTSVGFSVGRMNNGSGPFYQLTMTLTTEQQADWLHLVGVYQPSIQRTYFYVNGERVGEADIDVSVIYADYGNFNLQLADSSHGAATYYQGLIEDARVYNRALSASEIKQHYMRGR